MLGRDLLERFRPAAAPGAVSRVAVPAEQPEDAEVTAVLAALDQAARSADAVRARAEQTSKAVLEAADDRARSMLEQARVQAAGERAEAAAAATAAAEQEGTLLRDRARAEAEQIRLAAERIRPEQVRQTVAALRDRLGLPAADPAAPRTGRPSSGGPG